MSLIESGFEKFRNYERLGIGRFCELRKVFYYGAGAYERSIVIKKLLPNERDKEESIKGLETEAGLLSRLRSPYIVTPLDFVRESDGMALLLEWIPGIDFRRLQDKFKYLPPDVFLTLAGEIGYALLAIHDAKDAFGKNLSIIHRDLSLGNLMLTPRAELKVLDFGSATSSLFIQEGGEALYRGRSGNLPPEAFSGEAIDQRLDIFSMGTLLYRLATGAVPFRGENDREMMEQVINREPLLPSKLNRDYGRRENALIMDCLSKDRKKRFKNVVEFILATEKAAKKRRGFLSKHKLIQFFASLD